MSKILPLFVYVVRYAGYDDASLVIFSSKQRAKIWMKKNIKKDWYVTKVEINNSKFVEGD